MITYFSSVPLALAHARNFFSTLKTGDFFKQGQRQRARESVVGACLEHASHATHSSHTTHVVHMGCSCRFGLRYWLIGDHGFCR